METALNNIPHFIFEAIQSELTNAVAIHVVVFVDTVVALLVMASSLPFCER